MQSTPLDVILRGKINNLIADVGGWDIKEGLFQE